MNIYNADNHAANLPDSYRKSSDSNNYKLLEIERSEVNKQRQALSDIESILNIDNATGKTLDMYGVRLGQPRGHANDEQYKIMLKARIMRNLSNGSIPSVINCICETLGCNASDLELTESETPCTVGLVSLPLTALNTAGFTPSQITVLIKALFPVGVAVENLLYEGTFEFAATEGVSDTNAGFTDVENGTSGGYFGYLAGDTGEIILPI